ncbi:Chitin binding domain [Trinorchestia longiramus]|nr:Chitin binding domain [Trinorchestia longiramus]
MVSGRVAYDFSDGIFSVLRTPLQESFSCDSKVYGYYADISNACQVFHICLPVMDALGNRISTDQFSFFCGNRTVFSQDSLQCVHEEEAYPCELSESIYDLANSKFGTSEGIAIFNQPLDSLRENRQEVFENINLPENAIFELNDAQINRISDEPQVSEVEEPFPQFVEVELPETAQDNSENLQISGLEVQENQEKTFDDSQSSDVLDFVQDKQELFVQDTFVQDTLVEDTSEKDTLAKELIDIQAADVDELSATHEQNVDGFDDAQEILPVEFS